jgi:hypothetical protein
MFHCPRFWQLLYAGGGNAVRVEWAASRCSKRGGPVSSQIVTYRVDESTTVRFEIEPTEGFRPAGAEEVLGRVREAVTPAIEAAEAVLEKVKEASPDRVELKFGVKASRPVEGRTG